MPGRGSKEAHSGSEPKKAVQNVPLDNGLRYLRSRGFPRVSCVAESIFDVNLCQWRSLRPVAMKFFSQLMSNFGFSKLLRSPNRFFTLILVIDVALLQ